MGAGVVVMPSDSHIQRGKDRSVLFQVTRGCFEQAAPFHVEHQTNGCWRGSVGQRDFPCRVSSKKEWRWAQIPSDSFCVGRRCVAHCESEGGANLAHQLK